MPVNVPFMRLDIWIRIVIAIVFFALVIAAHYALYRKSKNFIRSLEIPESRKRSFIIAARCFFIYQLTPFIYFFFFRSPELDGLWLIRLLIRYPSGIWLTVFIPTLLLLGIKDAGVFVSKFIQRRFKNENAGQSPPDASRRRFLKLAGSATLAVTPSILGIKSAMESAFDLEVTHRVLKIRNLPAGLENLKLVQITDIHAGEFMDKTMMDRIVRESNAEDPDIVFLTGDYVSYSKEFVHLFAESFSQLKSRFGIYGNLGNHDYWAGPDMIAKKLQDMGVDVMGNERRLITIHGSSFNLISVEDEMTAKPDLTKALKGVETSVPTILMSHGPKMFDQAAAADIDLTLSGHTHGGQVVLDFVVTQFNPTALFYKYVRGHYVKNNSQLYVSRGLGFTGPPFRLNSVPEIAVFYLQKA